MRNTKPSVGRRLWYTAVVMTMFVGIAMAVLTVLATLTVIAVLLVGPVLAGPVLVGELILCGITGVVFFGFSSDAHYYRDQYGNERREYAADRMWERTAWLRNLFVRAGRFLTSPVNGH